MSDANDREQEHLERVLEGLLEKHLPSPPPPDPPWIRELDSASASPALFEALMLRQRMLETLIQAEVAPVPPVVQVAASALRCPFCHEDLRPEASDWVACRGCLARHHASCWRESGRCASCNGGACLPASARPAAVPGWLRWVAAAAVLALVALGGASSLASLRTARWREANDALLAQAADEARPLEERANLAARVLQRDPDNARAKDLTAAFARERSARLDAERELAQERERARLDREALEARARTLETDHALAAKRALDARTKSAEELLAQATDAGESTAAVQLLVRALALVPDEAPALKERLERRKFEAEIGLARRAFEAKRVSIARYWLQDAGTLSVAQSRKSELDNVSARIERYASGLSDLDEARELLARDQLLEARSKLESALESGVGRDQAASEIADITTRCHAKADELAQAARELSAKDRREAMKTAQLARRFDPASGLALLLLARLDSDIASDARREAAALSAGEKDARRALDVLETAAGEVDDATLAESLRRERRLRQRLLDTSRLAGFIFVPDPAAGRDGRGDLYVQRDLVTNEDFSQFVGDGGYRKSELWDVEARRVLSTFHGGPRTWTKGNYGGAENAKKPVRGVSIFEARAYARWLSRRDGARYRLPTAAEWERAAGLDPGTRKLQTYPWGDEFDPKALVLERPDKEGPGEVGKSMKGASPLGLRDASGALRQWVEESAPVRTSEYELRGTAAGSLKGSDFAAAKDAAAVLARVRHTEEADRTPETDELLKIGFRLVREPE